MWWLGYCIAIWWSVPRQWVITTSANPWMMHAVYRWPLMADPSGMGCQGWVVRVCMDECLNPHAWGCDPMYGIYSWVVSSSLQNLIWIIDAYVWCLRDLWEGLVAIALAGVMTTSWKFWWSTFYRKCGDSSATTCPSFSSNVLGIGCGNYSSRQWWESRRSIDLSTLNTSGLGVHASCIIAQECVVASIR